MPLGSLQGPPGSTPQCTVPDSSDSTLALVVWTRPEVQELPLPRAVMSRLPLPSRCTLLVELVIVSISPVPKLEPAPVSYIHWESMPDPDPPLKSSLKTVDQPDGGPGTAADAMAAGTARPATTMAGAIRASASLPLGRHLVARSRILMTRCDMPGIPGPLTPLPGFDK